MSKALAVQTSRLAGAKRFAASAASGSGANAGAKRATSAKVQAQASKRGLHVSGSKEARADGGVDVNAENRRGYDKQGRGLFFRFPSPCFPPLEGYR